MDQITRSARDLGAVLRRVRRQRGLTQAGLGERVGLRQATVSKLEAGEPGTRIETLMEVLGGLGLELVVRSRTGADAADIEDLF